MNSSTKYPILVTAGYDLSVNFTKIFEDKEDIPKFSKISTGNSQVNRIVITENNEIALALNPYVIIHDVLKNSKPSQYAGHISNVNDLVFSGDNFYTCSEDRTINFWDRRQGSIRPQQTITTSSPLNNICLHPNKKLLITCNENGYLESWDISEHKLLYSIRLCTKPIRSISQSRNGEEIYCGCHDGKVIVVHHYNDEFHKANEFEAHNDVILRCLLSPNEENIITTSADSTAKIWDKNTLIQKKVLKHNTNKWIWDAAFTNDSNYVVTGGTDKTYRTWNVNEGNVVYLNDKSHAKGITALALMYI